MGTTGCKAGAELSSATKRKKKHNKEGGKEEAKIDEGCSQRLLAAEEAVPSAGDPRQKLPQCRNGSVLEGGWSLGARCVVDIADLRPTQVAIGRAQMETKAKKIADRIEDGSLDTYLRDHPEPVVVGPGNELFIIDHHHLGAALLKERVPRTYAIVFADLSKAKNAKEFWSTMEQCNWVYPYRPDGERLSAFQGEGGLPPTLSGMADDPYRSLAGFVRRANGFSKVKQPFVEFTWARYFREQETAGAFERVYAIDAKEAKEAKEAEGSGPARLSRALRDQYEKVMAVALELAASPEALKLPGAHAKGGVSGEPVFVPDGKKVSPPGSCPVDVSVLMSGADSSN
jgi:hypothetical protein